MSQTLLPFANLASEILNNMKGRLRAVAVLNTAAAGQDEEDGAPDGTFVDPVLPWHDVPYMRELLRVRTCVCGSIVHYAYAIPKLLRFFISPLQRLKSILRRKPECDESLGIRPLLLDLQGVPRHIKDPMDSSIDIPFYPPSSRTLSHSDDEWFHLDQFVSEVGKLLDLITIPNTPFIIDERIPGSNILRDLIEQCKESWDQELFSARYKDWCDMVKLQHELNAGRNDDRSQQHDETPSTLSELSDIVREAEIELSIAMASRDQLERVNTRIEALRKDKAARYKVLAQIVFDVGYRELNHGILVEESPPEDDTVLYPHLSVPGVFGDQLTLSGECLPIG